MVTELWITNLEGLCFYHSTIGEKKENPMNDLLMTGFFSAITSFAFEITGDNIKKLDFGEAKLLFFLQNNLLFIVKADLNSSDSKIKKKIKILQDLFIKKFKRELDNFDGEISSFRVFDKDLDEIFKKISKSEKWGKGLMDL